MDYDLLDGVPCRLLGTTIKTKTQIILSCLVPSSLELIVYLFVTTADICVAYQHFKDLNPLFGGLTILFLCLPSVICFISIVTSPWQWPDEDEQWNMEHTKFLFKQFFNLIFFPIGAIYRFSRRIFWSIESLFHERNTYERIHATSKAAEYSPFELYHFIQAFFQSGPQIILQIWIMLRDNLFRNYETNTAQIISVVFSFITMAIVISTYQRFESQKIVGRNYPWASRHQIKHQKRIFRRTKSLPSPAPPTPVNIPYPEVLTNFNIRYSDTSKINNEETSVRDTLQSINKQIGEDVRKTLNVNKNNFNDNKFKFPQTDDEKIKEINYDKIESYDTVDRMRPSSSKQVRLNIPLDRIMSSDSNTSNRPDDDLLENIDAIKRYLHETDDDFDEFEKPQHSPISPFLRAKIYRESFDQIPIQPPPVPPPPTAAPISPSQTNENHFFNFDSPFQRMSTLKDMFVFNTEQYIKDHVPRLPSKLFEHDNEEEIKENNKKEDETDLVLPTRRKILEGIEQDDFIGRVVSFMGWILFLVMRMLSLSVFSVFYLPATIHILYAHYILMVLCLFWESKFQEKIERLMFYLFLGVVYIFSIIEFKIKFKNVRRWYLSYITFVFLQNLIMTFIWYSFASFSSWWYHYLFVVIIGSGMLSLLCLLFYYIILKPKDKIVFENEN